MALAPFMWLLGLGLTRETGKGARNELRSLGYLLLSNHSTAVLREAWATLPEISSRPLPATLAQSRNIPQRLSTCLMNY